MQSGLALAPEVDSQGPNRGTVGYLATGARYYATADGNNNITPGSPRAVRGSMTTNF